MSSKNLVYKVHPKYFSKKIEVPSSKSYANRALILGALKGNSFTISNLSSSTDVESLLKCLSIIGLEIERSKNTVIFKNKFPDCEKNISKPVVLHTGDGGTTNRFLIPLLALGKNEYHLIPSEKMSSRPMEDLILPLRELNVSIVEGGKDCWLKIKGPIKINSSELNINCEKSTQFASALKLVFINQKIKINLFNLKSSEAYLQMTDKMISEVESKNNYFIPVDFSSISYPLALALGSEQGNVTISNCFDRDLLQADSIFLDLITKIGGVVSFTEFGLNVYKNQKLIPFEVNGNECPDLVMTLAFLASTIEGTSTINNLEILKYKESDRLSGIFKMLNLFEVDYKFLDGSNSLQITGSHKLVGPKEVITERDHRMVMMGYLFLRIHSGGELSNIDCIEKSFPKFIEVMD